MVLRPPVEPMPAQAAEVIPPAHLPAAGVAFEQKLWTGWGCRLSVVGCRADTRCQRAAATESMVPCQVLR